MKPILMLRGMKCVLSLCPFLKKRNVEGGEKKKEFLFLNIILIIKIWVLFQ